MTAPAMAMELDRVTAGYNGATVLRAVSIRVPSGTVVALLGPNGAGKTTALKVACGLLPTTAGTVCLNGTDVSGLAPHRRAESGLCMIPEGRGIFRSLTVSENLRLLAPPKLRRDGAVDNALQIFPALRDRLRQTAGTMSGGQQQMLALARAYLGSPKVILLDEVSMGLSPVMVEQIYVALRQLAASGVALLLVEQYITRALEIADQVILMSKDRVTYHGPAAGLDEERIAQSYLGAADSRPEA